MIDQRLAMFLLLSALCCYAQEMPKMSAAEKEIRAQVSVQLRSPNRPDEWSGTIANDALFQLWQGGILSKQDLLKNIRTEAFEDSPEMSDTMFRQIGDAAIFSYVFRRIRQEKPNTPFHQHLRKTLVYQHTPTGWQMISSAISVIPFADLESKSVNPQILDSYTGVWNIGNPLTLMLTRDGGKLMAQGSNEAGKTELMSLSDSTFVIPGEPAVITFEKGSDGKIDRMLWHDIGGSFHVFDRIIDGKHP